MTENQTDGDNDQNGGANLSSNNRTDNLEKSDHESSSAKNGDHIMEDSGSRHIKKVSDEDKDPKHSADQAKFAGRHSGSSSRNLRKRHRSSSGSESSGSRRSRSRMSSKSRSKTHSRSPHKKSGDSKQMRSTSRHNSRSGSPARRRSRSSTSCDTYGSFKASSPARVVHDYPCKKCDRDFETIRELCEHEIRVHGASFPCPHCERQSSSVQKLCDHMKRRHDGKRLLCDFCKEEFGGRVGSVKDGIWEEFRDHIYKECLKEKIYQSDRHRGRSSGFAQRGRGRCPHGPPVKCKNFPNCPGEKCYYYHGICRYDKFCVKKECPFDHTERPRTCLSCLRDYRFKLRLERSLRANHCAQLLLEQLLLLELEFSGLMAATLVLTMRGAAGPTYLRNLHMDDMDYTGQQRGRGRDELVDEYNAQPESNETDLHVTGLRATRLRLLLAGLVLISLVAVIVLILNIFIISVLDMSTRGMRNLQFHSRRDLKGGEEESVVHFTAENIHLGKVVAKSGTVNGAPGKDLIVEGSRVIISGASNKSRMVLQDGICRLENVEQFVVRNGNRPFFSAQHPMYKIDRRIKKLASSSIVTNKIRSPINDNLYVDAVNLGLRGNEGVYMESKRINLTAKTAINIETSADGHLVFTSSKLFIGNSLRTLPLSSSPAFTASIDALRVCICMAPKPKLFTVPGNKPCNAPHNFCV